MASVVDQGADQVEQCSVFWPVGPASKKMIDGHVGYLSTGANVGLMFYDGHPGNWIARQKPGVTVAAFVQNSFGHNRIIRLARFRFLCSQDDNATAMA